MQLAGVGNSQNFMSFNQAQRGPDMSSNLVGMSKYTYSSNAASRSSVVMSAATISGDGAF